MRSESEAVAYLWAWAVIVLWLLNQANDTFGSVACVHAGGTFDNKRFLSLCLPAVKP